MVIGLNYRTAPMAMREHFWMNDREREEALHILAKAEGVQEAIVLTTCNRTELLVWADEPTLAANSMLHFLTMKCGLKLSEWEHFYRLLDEAAMVHIFRVASSLDAMVLGDPQINAQLKTAWEQARTAGTSGRFLDAVLQKALSVSERVHKETNIGDLALSVSLAAVALARQAFGSLEKRKVLLLGGGKLSEAAAQHLLECGATSVCVVDRKLEHAREVASRLGGKAAGLDERWQQLLDADILISSTGCPQIVLSRQEADILARERQTSPLAILDIAMPPDVDPAVREVPGILLRGLDHVDTLAQRDAADRKAITADAEKIVTTEAREFRHKLQVESVAPTIVALRQRLDQICRQELEAFTRERGPFTRAEDHDLLALTEFLTRRITNAVARELQELPEKTEQEHMVDVVKRLFHLDGSGGFETPARGRAATRH
jgi:glutamyl-tRNA reductase